MRKDGTSQVSPGSLLEVDLMAQQALKAKVLLFSAWSGHNGFKVTYKAMPL